MRKLFLPTLVVACALTAACGNNPPATTARQNSNSPTSNTQAANTSDGSSNVGVVSSHGGGNTAPAGTSTSGASTKPPVETPELDAKIQKAEAKAKAQGASDADKKAAAAAYFERADFYRDQGMPVLYKFALADYRCGLKYDPDARESRQKMDEIVQIYQSMGRPVPELGCTQ